MTADHKRHAIDLKMLQGEKINSDLQREPLFESHKGRRLELQVLICGSSVSHMGDSRKPCPERRTARRRWYDIG